VHNSYIKTTLSSGLNLLGTWVNANDGGTRCDERLGKPAVASTNLDNALAKTRFKQFDYFEPIFPHEKAVFRS
ncbi:MAG: hypothetical protein GTO13_07310, partial [Proteobacteria bacterium]|nr:hypothetical protein [Pseudomonadota bacterium]